MVGGCFLFVPLILPRWRLATTIQIHAIVDSQLSLLISIYEEEKAQLQKDIEVYLSEKEYLMAHYKSEALYEVNRRLRKLHNLEDPLYDQKDSLQRRLKRVQKQRESETDPYMKDLLERWVREGQEELGKLHQVPIEQTPSSVPQTFFDETLERLLKKEIKNLKLVLSQQQNLILQFSYTKNTLNITMPDIHEHLKKWVFYEDQLTILKSLGFQLSASGNRLTLSLTGDKTEILSQVKVILCKIIFEIFALIGFRNESFLCYNEKPAKKSER
ncbi:hypothetical protein BC659_0106 [Sediminibacterium goheungense]|uniref:Uncharacterized protein n=2 Tax=Sediminibacterium goheungense TaxID=1086393 RepID=A0A4V3C510_9BACT|nr:hypothetical protein BC659_0106 [Sediminibacterium goheungense]